MVPPGKAAVAAAAVARPWTTKTATTTAVFAMFITTLLHNVEAFVPSLARSARLSGGSTQLPYSIGSIVAQPITTRRPALRARCCSCGDYGARDRGNGCTCSTCSLGRQKADRNVFGARRAMSCGAGFIGQARGMSLVMSAGAGESDSAAGDGGDGEPELTMADVKKALNEKGKGEAEAEAENNAEDDDDDDDDDEYDDDEDYDRKVENPNFKFDPYRDAEEEKEPEEVYEQIVANMTKPLGITIEASTDDAGLVYITSVGEQAEGLGLRIGDVVSGVSAVFGSDVWGVKGFTVDKIRSMVRTRHDPYVLIRVERGHVSLEERCKEGFGIEEEGGLYFCTVEGDEDEDDYVRIWDDVYKEEAAAMEQGPLPGPRDDKWKGDQPPAPKEPGMGGFSNRDWGGF